MKRNLEVEQRSRLDFVSVMNGVWSEFTYTCGWRK